MVSKWLRMLYKMTIITLIKIITQRGYIQRAHLLPTFTHLLCIAPLQESASHETPRCHVRKARQSPPNCRPSAPLWQKDDICVQRGFSLQHKMFPLFLLSEHSLYHHEATVIYYQSAKMRSTIILSSSEPIKFIK